MTDTRIYLSPPDVGEAERKLLLEAFDSGWVAPVGPDLDAFEAQVAELVGVRHAVALSSGTAALHLALIAAGVRRGDGELRAERVEPDCVVDRRLDRRLRVGG